MAKGGKREGAGRKAGVPNKITANIKEAILGAFEDVGGQKYLVELAHSDPKSFCMLIGKIIPSEIVGSLDVSGDLASIIADARRRADGDS